MSVETWVATHEPNVLQRGEDESAEYKVQFPDGEEQSAGYGDEAFLHACRLRDEMTRNRAMRGVLIAEVSDVKVPPNPGDEVLIEGRLISIEGDEGHVVVGEADEEIHFAVEYGALRKYDRSEE